MVDFWFGSSVRSSTFAFTFTTGPVIKFSFENIATHKQRVQSFKRRRPLWDVDGSASAGKKKRRLRFNLITSRLSKPFSSPATNIINRGASKIAMGAKNKKLDNNILRRVAIMNRVRLVLDTVNANVCRHRETSRHGITLRELVVEPHRPKTWDLPPSPLGLSNYDALDLEDEGDDDSVDEIYSDFNIMKPYSPGECDSYDYLDELDGIPAEILDDGSPLRHKNQISDILMEHEQ